MARRWHVAAHNHQNEHRKHGRIASIMLRYTKVHGGSFVFIFTFATLTKSNTKKTQIVRAGFAVSRSQPWAVDAVGLRRQYVPTKYQRLHYIYLGMDHTSGNALWTLVSLQANKVQNSDNKGDYLQDHLSSANFKGHR